MPRALTAALALLCAASAALAGPEISVRSARGPVALPASPETLVVLDMAALDTLDLLGVPVAASVRNTYLDYLAEHAGEAGTLFEPDFEAIHAMAPDLVILGGRSADELDRMQAVAPAVDMTIWGGDLPAQARARLEDYGRLFGREARAAEIAAELDAAFARARAAASGKGDALILLTNGPKISVYGAASPRFGWIHGALGLPEAGSAAPATEHGEAVSFELVRDADPDWLLVVDRGAAIGAAGEGAAATLDNPIMRSMRVWREGRVVHLDSAALYIAGGGVQAILRNLDIIAAAFEAAPAIAE